MAPAQGPEAASASPSRSGSIKSAMGFREFAILDCIGYK